MLCCRLLKPEQGAHTGLNIKYRERGRGSKALTHSKHPPMSLPVICFKSNSVRTSKRFPCFTLPPCRIFTPCAKLGHALVLDDVGTRILAVIWHLCAAGNSWLPSRCFPSSARSCEPLPAAARGLNACQPEPRASFHTAFARL